MLVDHSYGHHTFLLGACQGISSFIKRGGAFSPPKIRVGVIKSDLLLHGFNSKVVCPNRGSSK